MFFLGEPSQGPITLSFLRLGIWATGVSHPVLLDDLASAAWLHGEDLRDHDEPGCSWLSIGTRAFGERQGCLLVQNQVT